MLEKAVWVSRQPDMHSVIGRQPVVSQQGTSRQPDWWPGWTHAVLGPQPDGHLAPDVGEQPGQGEGVDNYRSDMRLFIKHHVFECSSASLMTRPSLRRLQGDSPGPSAVRSQHERHEEAVFI